MFRYTLAGLLTLVGSATAADPPKTARRALLVGVTKYPDLAPQFQLEGPANDVKLMRATLTGQFGFADADITTLSEGDGTGKAELLPTRAAIEREFKRLAAVSKPGDEVVILLGGHGSQAPEKLGAAEPEIDGLDEIFLPRDVGKWDDKVGAVPNAILDDELGAWVTAIQKTGAFVWLIADACHSGTMLRAVDGAEVPRKTDPERDLGIPKKALQDAAERAAKRPRPERTRGGPAEPTALGLAGKKGVFALYAAQPDEPTPELPLPPGGGKAAVRHGVLTFAVCSVLTQAKSPVTYRELAQRVQQQYAAWGRTSPTPMIEFDGDAPDREVLGPGVWEDRGKMVLSQPNPGEWRVNAGRLLGLTPGSVLRVTPPAGMGDQPLGHVRVTAANVLDATVEPVAHDGLPAPKALPDGGRCAAVFVDYGEVRLAVAVASHYPSADDKLEAIPDTVRAPLVARLTKAATPTSLFRAVDKPADASWLLVPLKDGRVSLLPTNGRLAGKDVGQSKGYGPVPTDKRLEGWLADALGRIARADGLVGLAASRTQDVIATDDLAPKFAIERAFLAEVIPAAKPEDRTEERSIGLLTWPASDLTVFDQDRVRVVVKNVGTRAFDLTVLYVDTDHNIAAVFPKGRSNRVPAGKSVSVPILVQADPRKGESAGLERLVFLTVPADGPEVNFSTLAQKGPEKLRLVVEEAVKRDGQPTPFSRSADVLRRLVYKTADGTRGASADVVSDLGVGLLTWTVKDTPRPKAEPKK